MKMWWQEPLPDHLITMPWKDLETLVVLSHPDIIEALKRWAVYHGKEFECNFELSAISARLELRDFFGDKTFYPDITEMSYKDFIKIIANFSPLPIFRVDT